MFKLVCHGKESVRRNCDSHKVPTAHISVPIKYECKWQDFRRIDRFQKVFDCLAPGNWYVDRFQGSLVRSLVTECFNNQFTAHVMGIGDVAVNTNTDQYTGGGRRRIWCSFHDSMLERESEDDMVLLLIVGPIDSLAFIQKLKRTGRNLFSNGTGILSCS